MFASRLPPHLTPNALSVAAAQARASGTLLIDLTETNPTRVGLSYPAGVLSSLADPRGTIYAPDARGLAEARAAIAAAAAGRGTAIDPDALVLTASTSEAYAFLFKLLCDPGDAVLVPQPSYPLFDLLTALDGVRAAPYRLDPHDHWAIDRESLLAAVDARTRAVLVVSPNNPTGSMLRARDREWLVDLARTRGLALIADEVFAPYPLAPRGDAASLAGESRVLTFVLDGLSKSAGLPQVKLGWIAVSGPADAAREALARLEIIADTYLSVSTPVQVAAAALLAHGRDVRAAIAGRIARNLGSLQTTVRAWPALTLIEPEGGWSAVLRVPEVQGEEALALDLIERCGVLVHPGYFFDFAAGAHVVVSLLPPPKAFDAGMAHVARAASGEPARVRDAA